MGVLFKRAWELIVDDLDLTTLDFKFEIEKNDKAEPNKLELNIYNASPDHVAQLAATAKANSATGVRVRLSVGYVDDGPFLIFDGDAREVTTTQNGDDRITRIAAHDGGRTFRESRISQSFAPGASWSSIISACAAAMDIGSGNANDAAVGATVPGLGSSCPNGMVLAGRASDQLTRVTKACGMTWSIQNGVLQLLKDGKPLQTTSVRIASDSGLVGSPSVDTDSHISKGYKSTPATTKKKKKPHLLNVKTLMIPGIYPGRKVAMDSEEYQGGYQVLQAIFIGDTAGNDWNINSKMRPY